MSDTLPTNSDIKDACRITISMFNEILNDGQPIHPDDVMGYLRAFPKHLERIRYVQHCATLASLSPQTGLDFEAAKRAVASAQIKSERMLTSGEQRTAYENELNAQLRALLQEYQDALKAHDIEYRRVLEDERTATDYLDYIEGCLKDAGFFYEGDPDAKLLKREIPDRAERAIKGFAAAESEAQKLREALKKYGQCLSTCATQGQYYPARFNMNYCNCGLGTLLNEPPTPKHTPSSPPTTSEQSSD